MFKNLYTLKEASKELNVSVSTLHNWINKGFIKAVKQNGGLTSKMYISKEEIERKLKELLVG